MPGHVGGDVCKAQAVIITFSACAGIGWTTCIAFYIYRTVKTGDRLYHYERFFHIIVWSYSFLSASYVAYESTSFQEIWCWIPDNTSTEKRAQFIAFYAFLWCAWFANIVLYSLVLIKIHRIVKLDLPGEHSRAVKLMQRLIFVPIALVLLRLPGSIHRLYHFFTSDQNHSWLAAMQAGGDPGQGIADAILFGYMNPSIWNRFVALFCHCRRHAKHHHGFTESGEDETLFAELSHSHPAEESGISPTVDITVDQPRQQSDYGSVDSRGYSASDEY
jgi:Slime mold cyclic AMP receptor